MLDAFLKASSPANLNVLVVKNTALLVEKRHRLDKGCQAKPLDHRNQDSLKAFLPTSCFPDLGTGHPKQPLPPFLLMGCLALG